MPAPITRNLTILLTDIKGFTDKTSNKSRSQIQEMLDRHRDIVLPVLESRAGKLIKTIGDAFLMVFESPTDAVLAGVAVQDALAKHNEGKAEPDRLDVRIAINTGEVNLADNDIFGEPVNITARIEGVAQAGEVYFTEAVYLAMNKTEVPSSEVGQLQLKGIREKVRVYKVRRESPVGIEEPVVASEGSKPLWERLRQVPAAVAGSSSSEPPPKARIVGAYAPPPLARRAAALLIDLILCGIIASFFKGGDGEKINVRYDRHQPGKAEISSGGPGGLKVDDSGIHGKVGNTKISIDDNGVEIAPGDGKVSIEDSAEAAADRGKWKILRKTAKSNYLFVIVWFIYSVVFLKRMGATPGMRILRLAVVSQDGSPMDKKQPTYRSLFSILSGYAIGLGYLWGVWEKDRRTWHDLIAGTRVVLVD